MCEFCDAWFQGASCSSGAAGGAAAPLLPLPPQQLPVRWALHLPASSPNDEQTAVISASMPFSSCMLAESGVVKDHLIFGVGAVQEMTAVPQVTICSLLHACHAL